MKKLLIVTILALPLLGCASPILMKDPKTGQIAQCYSSGGVIRRYTDRDDCVENYEKLGWVKAVPD